MAEPESKPEHLYAVWHAPPPWTSWTGETAMFRSQAEAEAHARYLATLKQKAVVYRAYPVAEFQAQEPQRTTVYA